MAVNAVRSGQVSPQMNEVQSRGKYSTSVPAIAKKISYFMLGVVLIHALTSVPMAEAGFLCFTLCMSACTGATGGAFAPACVAACVTACATNPV
ncbi:MAG: hypothetical protein K1X28_06025 [Parachlamydiales bacterium]|nr:hypothetical protein [Parachlamydiales bacterium]